MSALPGAMSLKHVAALGGLVAVVWTVAMPGAIHAPPPPPVAPVELGAPAPRATPPPRPVLSPPPSDVPTEPAVVDVVLTADTAGLRVTELELAAGPPAVSLEPIPAPRVDAPRAGGPPQGPPASPPANEPAPSAGTEPPFTSADHDDDDRRRGPRGHAFGRNAEGRQAQHGRPDDGPGHGPPRHAAGDGPDHESARPDDKSAGSGQQSGGSGQKSARPDDESAGPGHESAGRGDGPPPSSNGGAKGEGHAPGGRRD